jgi:hypothetical protein
MGEEEPARGARMAGVAQTWTQEKLPMGRMPSTAGSCPPDRPSALRRPAPLSRTVAPYDLHHRRP